MADTKRAFSSKQGPASLRRLDGVAAPNTVGTLATPVGYVGRLVMAIVKYSAVPVQAGITVELASGLGAPYDGLLFTGAANLQSTVFVPTGDVYFRQDDAIRVTSPAGGGVITQTVTIYTEELGS